MSTDVQHGEMDLSGRVAEEIRALLARRRMSGRELARQLDVSPSWVSYRLTGSQEIGVNDLDRIASALRVAIVDLLPRAQREVTREEPFHPIRRVASTPVPDIAARFATATLPGLRRPVRTGR